MTALLTILGLLGWLALVALLLAALSINREPDGDRLDQMQERWSRDRQRLEV